MASRDYDAIGNLQVDHAFRQFIEAELLPLLGFDADRFWQGLESIVTELTPVNRELLRVRDVYQQRIDDWHGVHDGMEFDHAEYVGFLKDIGYLRDAGLIDAPASLEIRQGEAIDMPSIINVEVPTQGGIVVSGSARTF